MQANLKNGEWTINIVKELPARKKRITLCLTLDFLYPIVDKFIKIKCSLVTDTLWDYCIAWDAINHCIKTSTSYSSIEPLYGHFTEPYPKFKISIEIDRTKDKGIINFLERLSDFSYLEKTHKLTELSVFFPKEPNILEVVKKLREYGFDIRVHQTNRTIPEGFFRVCYPFTNDINSFSYISWQEVGEHKTADKASIPNIKGGKEKWVIQLETEKK